MAATPDQIIQNLLSEIERSIEDFNKTLPATQKAAFAKVIELSKDLELSNGRIKASVNNIRIFNRIKKELENIILSKQYLKNIDKFIETWDAVEAANLKYFSAINEKYTPPKVFAEIKKQSIIQTVDELKHLSAGTALKVRSILSDSIKTGSKFEDMVDDMRTFLTDTKNGDGHLVRYAKQITTDSLNGFNATYNQIATSDLGLVWFKFVGSLIRTSREICVKMIHAKETCMPFIHISQFQSLLDGYVCGKRVPINKKTGLPFGMIEGTTVQNYFVNRNGYGCAHQFYPVSSAIVPKSLREKFE